MASKQTLCEENIATCLEKIDKITGGINIGANASTKAFRDWLYADQKLPVLNRTEKGMPAMDDEAMTLLKEWCQDNKPGLTGLFDDVIEYRKWGKLKTTYLDGYTRAINPVTGRIHPDLMPLKAATGRFACQNPNCYDDQTEILTRRGFILFSELTEEDEVAQWESGDIYFVKPTDIIVREYHGEMEVLKNQHIDLVVTPDHRCLLQNRKNNQFYVVPARDYSKDAKQIHAGQFAFGKQSLSQAECVLIAATQADGCVRGRNIEFQFVKARKLLRLLNAIHELDIPYSDSIRTNGQVSITVKECETVGHILELLGERKAWGPWILNYDRKTVKAILEELPNWDGCFTRGNHYSSSVKENADWMQILYALTGIRAHLRTYRNGNPNSTNNYQVDITDRDYSLVSNLDHTTVMYDGKVYCVTVPSSFIMVRRNGQICVSGNCQNAPQPGQDTIGVRDFFIAPEGWSLLECDYSQAEIRLCAYLSQDQVLLDAYRNHEDVHALTTSAVFRIPLEEAKDKSRPDYKHRRTVAKGTLFGIMYGIAGRGLSRNLHTNAGVIVSPDECNSYIDGILEKYSAMARWQTTTKRSAFDACYVETALGRRRYLPNIRSRDRGLRGSAERMAINTPVQGLCADCLKLSMAKLVAALKDRDYIRPILTVHDSLVFEVRDDKIEEATAIVLECMQSPPPLKNFMPLIAEASHGKRYGQLKE